MGVAHARLTVRSCMPDVGPYGGVDATSPDGHGAGCICVVLVAVQAGAHARTGDQGERLTSEEPSGPIGVVHACVVVAVCVCGQLVA
jgi:hypothetical protein